MNKKSFTIRLVLFLAGCVIFSAFVCPAAANVLSATLDIPRTGTFMSIVFPILFGMAWGSVTGRLILRKG